jgi:3-dehydroquinate dehydratase-1
MRPIVESPFTIRGVAFGGEKPLFCIPLVGEETASLLHQAEIALNASADLIEWRADFHRSIDAKELVQSLAALRTVLGETPILFTLRIKEEGGAKEIPQDIRRECIEAVMAAGMTDIVDVELCNEPEFLKSIFDAARAHGVRVILSAHDFQKTPPDAEMSKKILRMHELGADVAKLAVMPQTSSDVLRLLQVTLRARLCFPGLSLCTMSMGSLGAISRVAGFLFGSDIGFAAGQTASAPGQIPIADARSMAKKLLQYS